MPTSLRVPSLAENVDTARVAAILVAVGDAVGPDQPIAELETDKATAEVPATATGKVASIEAKPGDEVHVGDVLVTLEEAAGSPAADAPAAGADEEAPGGEVEREELGTQPEDGGAKPAEERPAPAPKKKEEVAPTRPQKAEAAKEEVAPARPQPKAEAGPKEQRPAARQGNGHAAPAPAGGPVIAAPSVRLLARELGVDLRWVAATGAGGRISEQDVKSHVRQQLEQLREHPERPPLPDFAAWGAIAHEPLDPARRATARVVSTAWREIPHVTQHDRAEITRLEELRRALGHEAAPKVTLTAILIAVTARALRAFPSFNASLDGERQQVIKKQYVHMGVAVDTERGLRVPVIRDADQKSLGTIAAELTDLADKARAGRLPAAALEGGSFTITNLGGFGTTTFSPIVRWPEVAILGVGRAETHAVFAGEAVKPALFLPLCLSYDHRLNDGVAAARLLRSIASALENPLRVALAD